MKKRVIPILLALVLLLATLPAQASAWRSTSGNIFRFQNNGGVTILYANGGAANGQWWWVRPGSKLEYYFYGNSTHYFLYINGNSGSVYKGYNEYGPVNHWTFLGNRGGAEDEGPERGWLMAIPTPKGSK